VPLWKKPFSKLEIPTPNRDIPRNTRKTHVVVIGLEMTYPDNAIAIPPVTN